MKRRWPPQLDELERKPTLSRAIIVGVGIIGLIALALLLWPDSTSEKQPSPIPTLTGAAGSPTATITPLPPTITPSPLPPTPTVEVSSQNQTLEFSDGLMILSLADGYYKHLFVYHPVEMQFTRLTNNPWDDIDPAVSPDGTRLAYASRRNGFWDIYVFDFRTGTAARITDTLAYDGHPSWSPDGLWLAYESYNSGNLEIFIQSIQNPGESAVQLTDDPWPDFEPSWSPAGDQIAFTSLRSGESEIWTVKVNQADDRFQNISKNPDHADGHPAWSPDGSILVWSTASEGNQAIISYKLQTPGSRPEVFAAGSSPVFSPDGSRIITTFATSNATTITGYAISTGLLVYPASVLPSANFGMDWRGSTFAEHVSGFLEGEPSLPVSLRFEDPSNRDIDSSTGRTGLVTLNNVSAPHPYLSDSVDDFFNALRQEISRTSGWDVLANLENAYLPMTDPTLPGTIDEWLVTGLAYSINPLPLQAGWMAIKREDIGGEVYWRVYVRARYQDGSQGMPLTFQTWDLDARANGNPNDYEAGGALNGVPEGYWIDITEISNRFGWFRLPALTNWRAYYSASRFNHFAFTRGMNWETAMLELYPAEMIHQPTRVPSLTSTPTITTLPSNSRTATAQVNNWLLEPTNPNPRPTWTPMPEEYFP